MPRSIPAEDSRKPSRDSRLRTVAAVLLAGVASLGFVGCSLFGFGSDDVGQAAVAPESSDTKSTSKQEGVKQAAYYEDVASQIPYEGGTRESSKKADDPIVKPRELKPPTDAMLRPISLMEAIQTALVNSRIIRLDAEFLSNRSTLLNNPDQTSSIYDIDINRYGVNFGNRGELAAQADFAPRLTANMLWARDEQVQNNLFNQGLAPGATLYEESADWNSRIETTFRDGSTASVRMDFDYSLNNSPARLFGSEYRGVVGVDYRIPLLRGAGTEFTRILGPINRFSTQFNGLNTGVVIARINEGIAGHQLEADVRNQIFDVQQLYWDLYLSYQQYETQREIAKALDEIWKKVKSRLEQGLERGSAAEEAQAADNYYQARQTARQALADVYEREARLRRLLGMPITDDTLLKPSDKPVAKDFLVNWPQQIITALENRIELRRQQKAIMSLRLQLLASRSLLQPQGDFVSSYRLNAFGDQFLSNDDNDGVTGNGLRSINQTLFQGDQTGWTLGFEVSIPFGYRAERAQIQLLEWRLLKAQTALAEQEIEIQRELQNAVMRLQRWQKDMRLAVQRRNAADRRVRATDAEYQAGRTSLDLRLRARISSGEARVAYFRAMAEYNKAISNFYYRNGTLLPRSGVTVQGAIRPEFYESLGLKEAPGISTIIPEDVTPKLPPEPKEGTKSLDDQTVPELPDDGVRRFLIEPPLLKAPKASRER